MAFTFKDFDKSFSKHKSEQTTENFIHQYRSPENSIASIELIDFGISKILNGRTYTIVGTPHYMAPEVIVGKGYSLSADY